MLNVAALPSANRKGMHNAGTDAPDYPVAVGIDTQAEEAAKFYTAIFGTSRMNQISRWTARPGMRRTAWMPARS